MADRQSNTHQYRQSLITGLRGKTFIRHIYDPGFGGGKMKELIRTKTPFTDWNIDKRYGIRQLLDMSINTIHVLVKTDNKISIPTPWLFMWDKYYGGKKVDSIYYSFVSEKETGELPWEGTAYNNKGRLISKYILQGYRDPGETHKHRIAQLDTTVERGGVTLKAEIINFANTYNLTLPNHDIEDPKIFQISVNYRDDGTTPVSITYFTYEYKALDAA
jgi:hypothetical protein